MKSSNSLGPMTRLELGLHLTLILGGLDGLTHRAVLHHHVRDGNPADDRPVAQKERPWLGQRPDRGPQASMRSRSKGAHQTRR